MIPLPKNFREECPDSVSTWMYVIEGMVEETGDVDHSSIYDKDHQKFEGLFL